MKRIVYGTFTLLALVASVSSHAAAPVTYPGIVTKISDGDTIGFLPDGAAAGTKPWSIRMMSEDTAELHLPAAGGMQSQGYWGEQGKAELQTIIAVGDRVEVDNYGNDAYGRVLGKVRKGTIDVNLEMVASGWGALYIICDDASCTIEQKYFDACNVALDKGLGLFTPGKLIPELPFLFRSRLQKRPLGKFVANVRTGKYFKPEDYNQVDICDRVFFLSESAAKAKGFSPAF